MHAVRPLSKPEGDSTPLFVRASLPGTFLGLGTFVEVGLAVLWGVSASRFASEANAGQFGCGDCRSRDPGTGHYFAVLFAATNTSNRARPASQAAKTLDGAARRGEFFNRYSSGQHPTRTAATAEAPFTRPDVALAQAAVKAGRYFSSKMR